MNRNTRKRIIRTSKKSINGLKKKQTLFDGVIVDQDNIDGVIIEDETGLPGNVDGIIVEDNCQNITINPPPEIKINIDSFNKLEINKVDFACNPTQGCETFTVNTRLNNQNTCERVCQSLGANAGGYVSNNSKTCTSSGCLFPRCRVGECTCYVNATYNDEYDFFEDNNLTSDENVNLFRISQ